MPLLAPPTPDALLGYGMGARLTTYRDQERVGQAILAAAPGRVREFVYGKSPEGRPLRVFALSSPANIKNLEKIRADNARRARGETVAAGPAIVWINETIHGNEPASFESGMWLLHCLADPKGALANALEDVVVILNPVYNPDGHERFAVYYNSFARADLAADAFERQEPRVVAGRLNHFRFDMNRDRVAFSQDETRAEFAEMLRWGPHAYIDQHGQVPTYFMPPEPMSINPNVDRARNLKWTTIFGKAIARAFDAKGYSYFVGDVFDLYFPGYVDASTTLSGSIGMTHETDGSKYLSEVREDGSIWTMARGAEKHLTSALAFVEAAAANREALVADYTRFKRRATTGESAGTFKRVVLEGDTRALLRLKEQLRHAGIASSISGSFEQTDAHDYWAEGSPRATHRFKAGALVVDMAQPQGALAKALLEPGNGFEPEFVERQLKRIGSAPKEENYPGSDEGEFYDLTGWSLPYAHGLRAWWCESAPAVTPASVVSRPAAGASTVGYALIYRDREDALAAMEILASGVRGSAITRETSVGGRTFAPGTFLFAADRNEAGYGEKLREIARARGAEVVALTTQFPDGGGREGTGSESVVGLRAPKVGVLFGDGPQLGDVSGVWWTLEREWKLKFDALSTDILDSPTRLAPYTTLLVPSGVGARATDALKSWIREGGRLVVLDGEGWALGGNLAKLETVDGEPRELPGSLFRARLDRRLPASYGYDLDEIAVPVTGGPYYKSPKTGGAAVRLPDAEKGKLLSGWAWPDDTEKNLRGAVFMQDAPSGRGRVSIFVSDPFERALWPALHKLVLNAMLF